ncbi:MAG: cytochrome P450 [Acidimicrobiia bacterium]|nr:cytochrome P450 [Acidimicrobiia bacterium]
MLGVPEERRTELWDAANDLVRGPKPEDDDADALGSALTAGITLSAFGAEIAAQRRTAPKDDLLTRLVEAEVDGHRLSDEEIGAFVVLLGVAGNDTTRNTISQGVLAFADAPDQWDHLRSDPEQHLGSAVEEIVRWASPVLTFRRTATQDTEVAGQPVREGDWLVMFYASGNRDESVFDDPWTFDITRSPNDHVAFGGGGLHYCLGANLARCQLRSVFGELASRVERFDLGAPELLTSAFVHGVESLDCTFVPDRATA